VLASADALGDAARSLDARFDALAAAVSEALQAASAAEASRKAGVAEVMLAKTAPWREALDAQARALPPPTTAQEVMVWLRRAPAMAWVSYRWHGLVRSAALGDLADTVAALYEARATWEARDPGLKPLFAQHAELARAAAPTLPQGARRFAQGNPLVVLVLALVSLVSLVSTLRSALRPKRRRGSGRRRRTSAR